MNKIDRLSLTREEVLHVLENAISLDQAHEMLFHRPGSFNTRSRQMFNRKFDLDITVITTENRSRESKKRKQQQLDTIFTCDTCGREYRNGDHLCDNRSGRHFCSDLCSHKFSANANKEERNRKKSLTMKEFRRTHKHSIRCAQCGKPYEADLWTKEGVGICPDCVSKITILSGDKRLSNYSAAKKFRHCSVCGAERGKCKRPEICKMRQAFKNFIKCLGFDKTAIGTERVYEEYDRIKDWLNDLYWNQNKSIPEITEMTGYEYGDKNFIKVLRRFISFRSIQEGLKLSYQTNHTVKDDIFTTGSHTAWNGRKMIYRSSYELDLCKELDLGRIDYFVEGLTIDYYDTVLKKTRFAVPDFYLPEFNMIIEVKSSFTFDKQNMLDRANAYVAEGYNFVMEYEHKTYTADEISGIQEVEKNIGYYRKLAV